VESLFGSFLPNLGRSSLQEQNRMRKPPWKKRESNRPSTLSLPHSPGGPAVPAASDSNSTFPTVRQNAFWSRAEHKLPYTDGFAAPLALPFLLSAF